MTRLPRRTHPASISLLMLGIFLAAILTEDDPDLIARLKRKDAGAMTDVYDRYGTLAYSIVYRIIRHPQTAEDLVQEVFFRLWNRIPDFDSTRGSLAMWIVCMARSRALAMWIVCMARSRALDHARTPEWKRRHRKSGVLVLEALCFDNDPVESISVWQQMQSVKIALANLTENERRALELAYYEGLSQSQIADKLQQPLGTVKTWIRTALIKLRREVAGEQ